VRQIETLAEGYFHGPESLRTEIEQGHVALVLARMQPVAPRPEGCSEFEAGVLQELETVRRLMGRVAGQSEDERLHSGAFRAQAGLLAAGILSREPAFLAAVRRLHDRSGPA
jgi:hypothetical protein